MTIRKISVLAAVVLFTNHAFSQIKSEDITKKNSWLKAGLTAGFPVGKISDVSNFTLGLDLKGQLMTTNHIGIGLTSGYNHYFVKEGFNSFGVIPIGAFIRLYPAKEGFFAGTDAGYSFIVSKDGNDNGLYVRPQLGYHNYSWNIFGFYNHIFRSNADGGSIQSAGIGFTYNIHFK